VYAIYTEDDTSHCDTAHPDHALLIPSVATYLDSPFLVRLAQDNAIDAIHPGYGFLSESADFAARMQDAGITVIGPGSSVLSRTGDKLQAKQLAVECDVPVLPAMAQPTADVAEVRAFVKQVQYPVMVKAVDGGGGRGIRLVYGDEGLEGAVRGAVNESPSGMVFVEKAAVKGFRHVEVQIIGDGVEVRHLWERDCSVQRRFQKVVEMAPSLIGDRGLVQRVVDAAVRMGRATRYRSLGTVEFLVNEGSGEFYFLEINPRIQVEHTVTEELMRVDLVQAQLKLAMGYTFAQLGLGDVGLDTPKACAIQLRLCAEDPSNQFALSVGKVTEMVVPSGRGVRVDTHIRAAGANPVVVGAQLDNLLAKIIVTASTWEGAVLKARRVLADTTVAGVRTNLELLRGVVAQEDFLSGRIDTQWLESSLDQVLQQGASVSRSMGNKGAVGARIAYRGAASAGDPLDLTFAAAHLAPMEYAVEQRNEDWRSLVERLVFSYSPAAGREIPDTANAEENAPLLRQSQEGHRGIYTPTSYLFLAGDLNYRTSNAASDPMADNARPDWKWTRTRWPSWCDRVLYLDSPPGTSKR
ncbi:hypothetical protein ASPNIDRAFT_129399, partial [Aspergillus niger ATCC 1015]